MATTNENTTKRSTRTRKQPTESAKQPTESDGARLGDPDFIDDGNPDQPATPIGKQVGKGGPRSTKHTCFSCKQLKWVSEFKEGKIADLTRVSTCLFCVLAAENSYLKAQVRELEKSLTHELNAIKSKYEQHFAMLRDNLDKVESREKQYVEKLNALQDGAERGTALAAPFNPIPTVSTSLGTELKSQKSTIEDIVVRLAELEKVPPKRQGVKTSVPLEVPGRRTYASVVLSETSRDANNNDVPTHTRSQARGKMSQPRSKPLVDLTKSFFSTVKKTAAGKPKPSTPAAPAKVQNLLIGDSLVGRHAGRRFKQLRPENRVLSLPGAKIGRVMTMVEGLTMNRNSTLIVSVGGNDLYIGRRKSGSVANIVDDFTGLLKAVKSKVNRGIIVGLLPRKYANRDHYSKALDINRQLKSLCAAHSLRYLDLWPRFFGKDALYWRDGIHFSSEGGHCFAEQVGSKQFKPLRGSRTLPKNAPKLRQERDSERGEPSSTRNEPISGRMRRRRAKRKTAKEGARSSMRPLVADNSAVTQHVSGAKRGRVAFESPEAVSTKRPRVVADNSEVSDALAPLDPDTPVEPVSGGPGSGETEPGSGVVGDPGNPERSQTPARFPPFEPDNPEDSDPPEPGPGGNDDPESPGNVQASGGQCEASN